MTKMFRTDIDPYDALLELSARLAKLEAVHNVMADDYMATVGRVQLLEQSMVTLQQSHLQLTDLMRQTTELLVKKT